MDKLNFNTEIINKYIPSSLVGATVVGTMLLGTRMISNKRMMTLCATNELLANEYKRYRRKVIPNNKLKMMGEPMRRRGI